VRGERATRKKKGKQEGERKRERARERERERGREREPYKSSFIPRKKVHYWFAVKSCG